MAENVEFGYTAELPNKTEDTMTVAQKRAQRIDPHEAKMIKKALNKIKLSRDAWNAMAADIKAGAGKHTICSKYGLKSGYYKYIKKIMGFRS